MFRALTAALTLTTLATPAVAQSHPQHHIELWRAVERVGVEIRVNQSKDCDPRITGVKVFGWYSGITREMVVCQEYALETGQFNTMHTWTEEDFDTLRHEAHHLTQDCMDNSLNAELDSVYDQPIALALKVLGRRKAERVVELYEERGKHIQVMELEAFSVAQLNDPLEQVSDLQRFCF